MPWNGSGVFNRTTGIFTGSTVWNDTFLDDRDVRSDDHDTHDEDIATGLENTVTRDGQNQPSANLPMGNFRHTGVGNASARNDYAAAGQVQDQSFTFVPAASVAGTADAITLSPTPAITAYAAGQRFSFVAEGNNTGAVTVNVSSVGAQAVQKTGSALVSGDILTGNLIVVEYDGTQFQLLTSSALLLNAARTNVANNFEATQRITSTDAGSGGGPSLELYRDSASPAANDSIGNVVFFGEDDAGNLTTYANIAAQILDPTDTSEDGGINVQTRVGGSLGTRLRVRQGLFMAGASGGDQGTDTINASSVSIEGNAAPMLYGLQLSNGTDADHDIDVTAGQCSDADKDTHITLSAITKRIDATWSAGSGNGGRSSSVALTADTTYHVFAIVVSGSADVGFDTSVTAANLIADHSATAYRRLGSVVTDGSANIEAFTQRGDEFLWDAVESDYNTTNPGTAAVTAGVRVPTGIQVEAIHNLWAADTSPAGSTSIIVTSPDQADTAPADTIRDIRIDADTEAGSITKRVRTDTSAQIRYRFSASTAGHLARGCTFGYIDSRGKDD